MIDNNLGMMADMMETCTVMDVVTTGESDGMFGKLEYYKPGAKIKAMVVKRNSAEKQIAEAQGVAEIYDVVVESDVELLKYQSVFQRDSDGVTFRVTSNPIKAPGVSTVQIAAMSAERWVIPGDKRYPGAG